MSTTAKAYAFAAALVVAAAIYFGWRQYERAVGARDEKIKTLRVSNDSLEKLSKRVDIQFVTDTLRLAGKKANYDSAKASVEAKWLHDTIPVPVEVVKTIIQKADSTQAACSVVVTDCVKQVGVQRALVANRDSVISILKAEKPGILARCGLSGGYGATLSAGKLVAGPSVLAGCKLIP